MKRKFEITVEIDEKEETIDYNFHVVEGGPIKLRDFCYWLSEAYADIIQGWMED
jgi:hypothetical protein